MASENIESSRFAASSPVAILCGVIFAPMGLGVTEVEPEALTLCSGTLNQLASASIAGRSCANPAAGTCAQRKRLETLLAPVRRQKGQGRGRPRFHLAYLVPQRPGFSAKAFQQTFVLRNALGDSA